VGACANDKDITDYIYKCIGLITGGFEKAITKVCIQIMPLLG